MTPPHTDRPRLFSPFPLRVAARAVRTAAALALVSLLMGALAGRAATAAQEGGDGDSFRAAVAQAQLASPQSGERFTVGDFVPILWQADVAALRAAGATEWEAFLSVDGGKTYPLRITPHLDLTHDQFRWQVPAYPTRRARLLLRFGDERDERIVESSSEFEIVAAAHPANHWQPVIWRAGGRGEKPRPSDRGVLVWTEGSRFGGDLQTVAAVDPTCDLESARVGFDLLLPVAGPPAPRAATVGLSPEPTDAAPRFLTPPTSAPSIDGSLVRLTIHRFNE
mgnify:CR=1 FL=1